MARLLGPVLVSPALVVILLLFMLPLAASVIGAFEVDGAHGLGNFAKAYDFYTQDIVFTAVIVGLSTLITGLLAIAIGGYLTLGENPTAVAILRWLYRWPMFIPFIVVGQILRTFLAKSGLFNSTLIALGLLDPLTATSYLDWRGVVIAFVWKQTPFVALMVAGAMASLDRGTIEAARNLGASRLRILVEIVVPQVTTTLLVGLVLSFVTMMGVLSVPLMINAQAPTMITADIAFRLSTYRDYGVSNALGLISLAISAVAAWFYLRVNMRQGR